MTITIRPEHEQLIAEAIRAGVIVSAEEVLDVGLETILSRLQTRSTPGEWSRHAAVQSMREFGEKYRLDLGDPITRKLLHEEHRY